VSIKELERLHPGYTALRYKCMYGGGGVSGRPTWMRTMDREILHRARSDTGGSVHGRRPSILSPIADLLQCIKLRIPFMSKTLRLDVNSDGIYGHLFIRGTYLLSIDLIWGVVTRFTIPDTDRETVKYGVYLLRHLGVYTVLDLSNARRKNREEVSVLYHFINDDLQIEHMKLSKGSHCGTPSKIRFRDSPVAIGGMYFMEMIRDTIKTRIEIYTSQPRDENLNLHPLYHVLGVTTTLYEQYAKHLSDNGPYKNILGCEHPLVNTGGNTVVHVEPAPSAITNLINPINQMP